jgi:2-hydroxychromene-2-carboxylate isomerase
MASAKLDFWFTMGSTYSFLTVMRLEELARSTGVSFRWRPFHLLVILQEMDHVPFANKPAKLAYMWRDIERRAAMYGIPARLPAPYPAKHSVVANLVATVGMREGWGADFVRAAYRRWFQLGQETGDEPNLSESLRDIGQDPSRVMAAARSAQSGAPGRDGRGQGIGDFWLTDVCRRPTTLLGRRPPGGCDQLVPVRSC